MYLYISPCKVGFTGRLLWDSKEVFRASADGGGGQAPELAPDRLRWKPAGGWRRPAMRGC